jgi:hypothetical protein
MVITPPPEPRTFKLVLGWKDHSDRRTRGRVLLKHRVIEHGLRRRGLVRSQLLGARLQGLARRRRRINRASVRPALCLVVDLVDGAVVGRPSVVRTTRSCQVSKPGHAASSSGAIGLVPLRVFQVLQVPHEFRPGQQVEAGIDRDFEILVDINDFS